ncbi:MAG: hypothetical protein Q7U97_02105 [Rhodocyclaceae bacterium]|nr:hypothetical protein [Rhodocyclaceae bacterium]
MDNFSQLLGLALAWVAYGLLHSALAALAAKDRFARRWPDAVRYYRLGFNLVAVVTLLPVLWLGHAIDGDWLWRWSGAAAWLANGLALAAVAGFFASTRYYDMDAFLGLRQVREAATHADGREVFRLSPFHRYVRHPWYFFALVLVWTRDMTAPALVSAAMITLYFVLGSRLEERKLLAAHGDVYRRYMARVPGLLPLPWKTLSRAESDDI